MQLIHLSEGHMGKAAGDRQTQSIRHHSRCRGGRAKASEILEGRRLAVLNEVLLAITRDRREREILRLPGLVRRQLGAGAARVEYAGSHRHLREIFQQWPELMAQPHIVGTVNLFIGENLFHVLAANSQEKALVRLIQLAYERLDRDLLRQCFTSQATGPFFWEKPMNGYGGTPLGYACSFCMKVRHGPEMTLHSGLPSKQQCVLSPQRPTAGCPWHSTFSLTLSTCLLHAQIRACPPFLLRPRTSRK